MSRRKASRPPPDGDEPLDLQIADFVDQGPEHDYRRIRIATSRGDIACRHYPVADATAGAVWVSGAIGGFHSPALGLYPNLSREFVSLRIASLQIQWRTPADLPECTLDTLAGIAYLQHIGLDRLALIGHSFGGAVIIHAAAISQAVRTIVPLSTQSFGADPAADLAPRCSILLIHGQADEVLPPRCSEYVYSIAGEPKKILLLARTRHGLDEAAEDVHRELRTWIPAYLASHPRP